MLSELTTGSDHVTAEALLASHGWTVSGFGDWAVVLRSPSGELAARISPFDPVAPYTVRLFREAAGTHQVPILHAHRGLEGGAVMTVMEFLLPAERDQATSFFQALEERRAEVAVLADVLERILARASDDLPWCDRVDANPANVMRRVGGGLVLTDPFDYAAEDTLMDSWAAARASVVVPEFATPPGWGLAYSGPAGRPRMHAEFAE